MIRAAALVTLVLATLACGRNGERRVIPFPIENAFASVGVGRFESGAGQTVEIFKGEEKWGMGVGLSETRVFKMKVIPDAPNSRVNVVIEYPPTDYGSAVYPASIWSREPANKLGIFGVTGETSFEVHCDFLSRGEIQGTYVVPTIPKGSKAKYEDGLEDLKAMAPDVNLIVLLANASFAVASFKPGVPIATDYHALSDAYFKAELGAELKRGCGYFTPSMNFLGQWYGVPFESMSANELRIVSTYAKSWSKPVFNKTERERSFRRAP